MGGEKGLRAAFRGFVSLETCVEGHSYSIRSLALTRRGLRLHIRQNVINIVLHSSECLQRLLKDYLIGNDLVNKHCASNLIQNISNVKQLSSDVREVADWH